MKNIKEIPFNATPFKDIPDNFETFDILVNSTIVPDTVVDLYEQWKVGIVCMLQADTKSAISLSTEDAVLDDDFMPLKTLHIDVLTLAANVNLWYIEATVNVEKYVRVLDIELPGKDGNGKRGGKTMTKKGTLGS